MNNIERQRIEYLRRKGESFASIGKSPGISENAVKSYCHRNNIIPKIAGRKKPAATHCGNCAQPLVHTPGKKKKRFCSMFIRQLGVCSLYKPSLIYWE